VSHKVDTCINHLETYNIDTSICQYKIKRQLNYLYKSPCDQLQPATLPHQHMTLTMENGHVHSPCIDRRSRPQERTATGKAWLAPLNRRRGVGTSAYGRRSGQHGAILRQMGRRMPPETRVHHEPAASPVGRRAGYDHASGDRSGSATVGAQTAKLGPPRPVTFLLVRFEFDSSAHA
jgi:hypothetical protein